LQLHLQLQNKILIATTLATEKYFITEESLSCTTVATKKNLSCNPLVTERKTLSCNHNYNCRKIKYNTKNHLGDKPTQLKKESSLQPYLKVATIMNNNKNSICALCDNRIGDRTGRPRALRLLVGPLVRLIQVLIFKYKNKTNSIATIYDMVQKLSLSISCTNSVASLPRMPRSLI
jgi:hypothetical protein